MKSVSEIVNRPKIFKNPAIEHRPGDENTAIISYTQLFDKLWFVIGAQIQIQIRKHTENCHEIR